MSNLPYSRRFIWLTVLVFAAVASGWSGTAAQATEKPPLKLFVAEIPGYMGGADPQPGMLVELARLAARKSGYQLDVLVVPWARALKSAMSEANALIPGVSRIPSREQNYTWIVRQMEVQSAFLTLTATVDSMEAAKSLSSIGVHRATSHEIELEQKGFVNLRSFNNIRQSIQMLEIGRIDAWYGDINEFTRRWREHATDRGKTLVIGRPQLTEHIWLAGSKSLAPEIVEDLSYGMRLTIEEGSRSRLLQKYFGR